MHRIWQRFCLNILLTEVRWLVLFSESATQTLIKGTIQNIKSNPAISYFSFYIYIYFYQIFDTAKKVIDVTCWHHNIKWQGQLLYFVCLFMFLISVDIPFYLRHWTNILVDFERKKKMFFISLQMIKKDKGLFKPLDPGDLTITSWKNVAWGPSNINILLWKNLAVMWILAEG